MLPYIAEFLGTMMLIILGDGVVANVNLNKSGMKGAGAVQITLAWGLAVLVPAFIFGEASGASFNPALTIALAVDGSFAWSMVPGYVIAQLAGRRCPCIHSVQRAVRRYSGCRIQAWRILYRSVDPEHWIKHFKRSSRYFYPCFRDQGNRQCNRTFHRC